MRSFRAFRDKRHVQWRRTANLLRLFLRLEHAPEFPNERKMNVSITTSNAQPAFMWYTIVPSTEPLEQGDFLDNFPVIIPPASIGEVPNESAGKVATVDAEGEAFNVILMTQSCDIRDFRDDAQVILCPRYPLKEAKQSSGKSLNTSDGWGKLIRGNVVGAHLINKCDIEKREFDYQVVDLQRIFSVPLSVVKAAATYQEDRVRLLPPYREHLAQAFARQFMRVGLPIDLPRDWPYATKSK